MAADRTEKGQASNGRGHGTDGRFLPGNAAARTDGLRSASRAELRKRSRRTSLRVAGYVKLRAEDGRPLRSTQLPIARRYAELSVLADDWYAKVTAEPDEASHLERYLSVVRALVVVGDKLGEGPTVLSVWERDRPALQAAAAQERLRAKVAAAQSSVSVNGHAGRLAASEVAE